MVAVFSTILHSLPHTIGHVENPHFVQEMEILELYFSYSRKSIRKSYYSVLNLSFLYI